MLDGSEQLDKTAERHGCTVTSRAIVLHANFQSLERIRIPSNIRRSDYVKRDAEQLERWLAAGPY